MLDLCYFDACLRALIVGPVCQQNAAMCGGWTATLTVGDEFVLVFKLKSSCAVHLASFACKESSHGS